MLRAIAIGILGLALLSNRAAAQTAAEQAQILRDFQRSVVEYTWRHQSLHLFPEAITAATPAPKVFTLPVAMVFRQLITRPLLANDGTGVSGVGSTHHAYVMQPFPASELLDFPKVLSEALPPLPEPLEYRLVGNDLVIRDAEADLIIAVLHDALGASTTLRLK